MIAIDKLRNKLIEAFRGQIDFTLMQDDENIFTFIMNQIDNRNKFIHT